MKKIIFLGSFVAVLALTSCNDFLNDNRYPLSQQTANSEFWSSAVNVEGQINNLYNDYIGYGNQGGSGDYYFNTLSDDQCGRTAFTNWNFTNTPASSTYWTAPYIQIRLANLIIEGVEGGNLAGSPVGNDFVAKARLHRARQYFLLVKRYGDVPLVNKVLNPDDEAELYGPRTPRNTVMDFVLEDLNYAVNNISATSGKTVFSSDLANAIKAEVCLFEGTFAKYHQNDMSRAQTYLQACVTAGEAIASKYPVQVGTGDAETYRELYTTLNVALVNNPEVIFCKLYNQGELMHSTIDYSNATDGIAGLTKDAFDSYLFLDGRPLATTTLNKTDLGVPGTFDNDMPTVSIQNLLDVRDQRLAQTTYPNIFYTGMTWNAPNAQIMASCTGYGIKKYNNFDIPRAQAQNIGTNYTSCPLFWGARLYLAIAEAKAELGTITNQDITTYIAPLWARAGIQVTPTLDWLSNMNDPANNMGVSSLIWEIRRCRRNELIMDDNLRYWDLIRWHQLNLLDTQKNPNIKIGANISNSPVSYRNIDGYVLSYADLDRIFSDREYLFPIPTDQIGLNPQLTQNPGWN